MFVTFTDEDGQRWTVNVDHVVSVRHGDTVNRVTLSSGEEISVGAQMKPVVIPVGDPREFGRRLALGLFGVN